MERSSNTPGAPRQGGASSFNVKGILDLFLRNWYWFFLSLLVAGTLAFFRVKTTPPVYERTASILIKSGDKAGDETLRELGLSQTPSNLVNEILMMNTSVVATEIVRRLHLDVDYFQDGTFYKKTVYGLSLPLGVRFLDLNDGEWAGLHASLSADGTLRLSGLQRGGETFLDEATLHMGDTVLTPIGRLAVLPSPYYKKGTSVELDVVRSSLEAAAGNIRWRISAGLRNPNSTIIDVRYRDVSPSRAEDVLNTLVAVYNENWMQDRNQRIVSTNEFIKDRLGVIEQELGDVDQDISSYKSEHLFVDVNQAGGMAVAQAESTEQQATAVESRIYLVRSVRDYLQNSQNESQQIPYSSGIGNPVIEQRIFEYNNLILQRNNHQANSSLQNPLVGDMNKQLAVLRESILMMLDSELAILRNQQATIQSSRSQAVSRVASNPEQAKYLLSVERQQKVKEQLYLFLLQKREENELSQAFTAYNTQLIEPPHGGWSPIEPVARTIYMIALLLGLAVPAGILLVKELLKTTVQGREDLKQMKVPFAGEIPLAPRKKKKIFSRKEKGKKETPQVLVVEKSRDMMNEAFRVVRSNLEFMLGFDSSHKIIMLTSLNPGSGKTFTTANLASVIGIKGKKVLAIDLDLRKGSLSEYVGKPHTGISSYLSGKSEDYHDEIIALGKIDVLPCGKLPPNPSELLYTPRFEALMKAVRDEYDYVFIDCPPLEIVADASIIGRYVDLTLFVVRAKLFERSALPEIDKWYEERKYTNLSIILNGTEGGSGYHRYGYHRYGYGAYGYGRTAYGYGDTKE